VFGILIFLAVFFFMTSFVWDISISGNTKIKNEVILQKLAENGIKQGTLKYRINTARTVDNMMLEMNDLARISVAIKGTRVLVNLTERIKPPDLVDKNVPCNIIAAKDGIISSIMAKEGLEKVMVGQTVTKGQLLITGIIENKYDDKEAKPLIVHSMGVVQARTWYEAGALVEQKKIETSRTGLEKDLYTFVILGKKIRLFHSKIPFGNCEHVEVKNNLSIGKNLVLPMGIMTDKYFEYKITEKEINIDEARGIAASKALKLAMDQIPSSARITKKDVSIVQGDNGINTATAIVECIEDIGVTQEIGGQ
jgi:similar to stage IV sporulation protein